MNNLGKRLKEIREKRGFPQKVVAEYLGLHRSNYSKVENGIQKLTGEQVAMFCEFCDVSADYVLNINTDNKVTLSHQKIDDIKKQLNDLLKLIE